MPILVNNIQTQFPVSDSHLELLTKTAELGLEIHGKKNSEVSIILADNPYIQELNCQYRHIDQPTDVLSFAMAEEVAGAPPCQCQPEGAPELLGDIFISVEKAQEQAESYGHSFERELCYLAVHGLLHLLGFDHQTPEEITQMRDQEESILKEFDLRRKDL